MLSSDQSFSCVRLFATPWITARQASLSTPTPGVHWDSHPSNEQCHPAISSLSSPSPPAPNPSQHQSLFQWVNSSHEMAKSSGVSALASFLPKKSQGWSPSEWTGWISLKSKGLSKVFSNTTVQKHQFFSAQPSSQSKFHSGSCRHFMHFCDFSSSKSTKLI